MTKPRLLDLFCGAGGEALGLRTQDVHLEAFAAAEPGRRGGNASTGYKGPSRTVEGPGSVTIAHGLRYIPPPLRAEGEGPYRLTGTKTGETREIPLPAFVAEALRVRLAERDAEQRAAKVYAPNGFVFCDPVGNSVPLETLRTWYLGALKRAGLPPARWHDLRATTLTLLLDMGVSDLIVMAVAGHRDLKTTQRYKGKTPHATVGAMSHIDEAMG